MDSLVTTLLSSLLMWGAVSGCSLRPGVTPPEVSMEDTLEMAPIVVSGKDIYHEPLTDSGFRNYTFLVSCVFKMGNMTTSIPRTIFLVDVGAISCDGTEMEEGKSYVVGLKVATDSDITWGSPGDYFGKDSDVPLYYKVYEPAILNTGAFEASPQNLNKTSMLCSMDDVIQSLGVGDPDDHECPTRSVTMDICVSGATSVLMSPGRLAPFSSLLGALLSLVLSGLLSLVFVV